MKKAEFLKELEKRLKVLNSEERNDIINEHRDIIEEKIKAGKSEEEAVADFGKINDLTKEILKAYKVDPDYNEEAGNFDDVIKKAANWLSEKSKSFFASVDKKEITSEHIFEIIIKVFIVLVVLHILRIPFFIFSSMGSSLFEHSIFPFILLKYIWIVLIEMVYIISAILIVFVIFKDYFFVKKNTEKTNKSKNSKSELKKEKVIEEKLKKENTIKETSKNEKNSGLIVIKVLIFVTIVFPLAMLAFALMISLSFLSFFVIKGLILWGPLLLVLGLLLFVFFVISATMKLLDNQKINGWPLLTVLVLVVLGLLLTFDWAFNLTIKKGEPGNLTTESFVLEIDEYQKTNFWQEIEIIIDPKVKNDEIVVEISFNDKYAHLVNIDRLGNTNIHISSFRDIREFANIFVSSLKKDELYLPYYEIKIYGNEQTIEKIPD